MSPKAEGGFVEVFTNSPEACNTMIDEEIWLALFRIRLGIWCLLMHVNEGEIRNLPC